MCLIAFAWDSHPKYKLILAGNRDEFYERPTLKADYWSDHPNIFGGRDQQAMGTWMAISRDGRFGALTNYRDLKNLKSNATSRGEIISDFLLDGGSPEDFLKGLHEHAEEYNGFNFLASDFKTLCHYSNYERKLNLVRPGIHGLSNSLLDTEWPKVSVLKKSFEQRVKKDFSHDDLLDILTDDSTFDERVLPKTGVSPELEKALSTICIRTEKYGTCSSSVLTVDRMGVVNFTEKTYGVGNRESGIVQHEMKIKI